MYSWNRQAIVGFPRASGRVAGWMGALRLAAAAVHGVRCRMAGPPWNLGVCMRFEDRSTAHWAHR